MERFHYTIKQKLEILEMYRSRRIVEAKLKFPKVTYKYIERWRAVEDEMREIPEKKRTYTYTHIRYILAQK